MFHLKIGRGGEVGHRQHEVGDFSAFPALEMCVEVGTDVVAQFAGFNGQDLHDAVFGKKFEGVVDGRQGKSGVERGELFVNSFSAGVDPVLPQIFINAYPRL